MGGRHHGKGLSPAHAGNLQRHHGSRKKAELKDLPEQYTPSESRILASTPDGTEVKVELVARPNEITTVKIRFGMMGNDDWSAYYHRQIMKILRIPDQP